jgi:hypothetical protein
MRYFYILVNRVNDFVTFLLRCVSETHLKIRAGTDTAYSVFALDA